MSADSANDTADRPPLVLRTRLDPVGPATAIELTDAQVAELGGGKRAAVVVTVGDRTARLRLARMGGANLIGLSKAARAELNVEIGDDIEVAIVLDHGERSVDVPEALVSALEKAGARAGFEAWPYSRRKEAARSVTAAKRPETVDRRIAAVIAELRAS
ncbi:YdeI/OmpD-associated family protein [Gordonia liuliyuniae]|uniref:YdeI/OmpD-associated family protein n=1 Tax=Gordonia liuliyuniae TaxID=2911517 RepID=A0ABS9IRG7_9ACTN|nr:YdeI/OmpD-associated family protein [Gordonia liuliyuniae]MCF8588117.1 YdeI/OmpD-associated family protein [Gordonia liuliyuniae]